LSEHEFGGLKVPHSARRPVFYPTGFRVGVRAAMPEPAGARFWGKSMIDAASRRLG
jgi:hypothetical protein